MQDLVTPVSPFFSPSHESWKLEPLIFNPFPLQLEGNACSTVFFGCEGPEERGWGYGGVVLRDLGINIVSIGMLGLKRPFKSNPMQRYHIAVNLQVLPSPINKNIVKSQQWRGHLVNAPHPLPPGKPVL